MNNRECMDVLGQMLCYICDNQPNGANSIDAEAITHAIEHMKRGQWQPIETAPRREPFIATGKTETPCVVTTTAPKNENVGYPFCCYHTQVCFHESKFTHWMPLPEPPQERKD